MVVSEMQPWQKFLLLISYPDLRERLDPLTMVDEMIVLGIIEPVHRESLQRINRLERTGWVVWRIVRGIGTEQCYNSLMKVLQQNEPKIFRELKDKEDLLKNGNHRINPQFNYALITKLYTTQIMGKHFFIFINIIYFVCVCFLRSPNSVTSGKYGEIIHR